MLRPFDFNALAKRYDMTIDDLKKKPYCELEDMVEALRQEEIKARQAENAKSDSYSAMIKKYSSAMKTLSQYFTEDEIVKAYIESNIQVSDICTERCVTPGSVCTRKDSEYLRRSYECVPAYDRHGRQYLERDRKLCDVYRVRAQYEGKTHSKVISKLLFDRYPELKEFGFEIYPMDNHDDGLYEIYPKNHMYTPLACLLAGDVDGIVYRNREYCKTYNNSPYTPDECEKRIHDPEVLKMFDRIKTIGYTERQRGNYMLYYDFEDNLYKSRDGLVQTGKMTANNVCLLTEKDKKQNKKRMRICHDLKLCPLNMLLTEYISLVFEKYANVTVHVRLKDDLLGENGLTIDSATNKWFLDLTKDDKNWSNYDVLSTFGWTDERNSCASMTFVLDA